jgi:hypothetical protein
MKLNGKPQWGQTTVSYPCPLRTRHYAPSVINQLSFAHSLCFAWL